MTLRPWLASLKARLLCVALIALLPLALLALYGLIQATRYQHDGLKRSMIDTVRALSTAVDTQLSASLAAAEILAISPSLQNGDLEWFHDVALRALDRHAVWDNVVLTDTQGQQLVNLRAPFGAPLPRSVESEGVMQVAREGRSVVTDLLTTTVAQGYRFGVRVPVFHGNSVRYVLTAGLKPSVMQQMLERQRVPQDSIITIVDTKGVSVARSLNPEQWVGRSASDSLLGLMRDGGDEAFGVTTSVEGRPVYTAYSRSPVTGWSIAIGVPRSAVDGPIARSYALLALAVFLSVILGILGSLVVARTIIRPIRELRTIARADVTDETQAPDRGIPEVREVAEALIRSQRDRKALLEKERTARSAAEQEIRSKDEFLAMLSHELRNPLAAISSATALIEAAGGVAGAARAAPGIIRRQARHLASLLDDLLDVGRVINGKIMLQKAPLNLARVVARAVENVNAARPYGRRAIETRLADACVNADASRMEQVVTNLLTNACKYTTQDGSIRVELAAAGGEAVLAVIDDGSGIEPELLPRVFDLFVQGSRTIDRSEGGLGIGLTLVKRIVEIHGGTVSAGSGGPGKGARFEVRLPAVAEWAPRTEHERVSSAPASGRRVLVIEDNDDERSMLKALLELKGYVVDEARDGSGGIRAGLDKRPDIALIDIGLPGRDGYAVARALRAGLDSSVRLVALTGYGQPQDRSRALDAGFDCHVVKPASEAELERAMA